MRHAPDIFKAWVSPHYMDDNKVIVFGIYYNTETGKSTRLSDFNTLKSGAGFDVLNFLSSCDPNRNFAVVSNGKKAHLLELTYDPDKQTLTYCYAKGRSINNGTIKNVPHSFEGIVDVLVSSEQLAGTCYHHHEELALLILQSCLYSGGFRYRVHTDERWRCALFSESGTTWMSHEITNSVHLAKMKTKENKALVEKLKPSELSTYI